MTLVGIRLIACCMLAWVLSPAIMADILQVLYSWILDLPVAFSTTHPTNPKLAYALDHVLAKARLPRAYDGANG
jgi:hypothetical protein